jgi:thiol-disulfide isomerase/thioredoxin
MIFIRTFLFLFLSAFACPVLSGQVKVAFFLSPTCTICRYYALEMRELSADYAGRDVEFIGYAVGPLLTDSVVASFREEYKIPFSVVLDDTMHRTLNATVTPEVFVLHSDTVVYHGRIDDSFLRVGKRRAHVKNRELRSVLDSILQGRKAEVHYVPAVGCIIEK